MPDVEILARQMHARGVMLAAIRYGWVAVLALAAGASLKRGLADALFQTGGIRTASRIEPGNATYLIKRSSPPAQSDLEKALTLDPGRSEAWIELAVRAELAGDAAGAERLLKRALAASRQYETNWALANFYFRQGDNARFLQYGRAAAAMSYGDLRPLFDLCHAVLTNPEKVLAECLADRHQVVHDYLVYLLEADRPNAASVAVQLARFGRVTDRDALLRFCDRALRKGDVGVAVAVWNAASESGALDRGTVNPQHPRFVNSSFRTPITRGGFEWQFSEASGVRVIPDPGRRSIIVHLSGGQPDDVVLFSQLAPILRNEPIRLTYEFEGDATSVWWIVFDETTRTQFAKRTQAQGEVWIPISPKTRLIRVAAVYRTPEGARRTEGSMRFGHLSLE